MPTFLKLHNLNGTDIYINIEQVLKMRMQFNEDGTFNATLLTLCCHRKEDYEGICVTETPEEINSLYMNRNKAALL